MRFLTRLRRLDDAKKDRFVLISTIVLTLFIVFSGFWYTTRFSKKTLSENQPHTPSTLSSTLKDIKTNLSPTVSQMKSNIDTITQEYEKNGLKNFFVPKTE